MKTKRVLLLLVTALCLISQAQAQTTVTLTGTKGELDQKLGGDQTITYLIIKGKMNVNDYTVLRTKYTPIVTLDLGDVTDTGYNGSFPEDAFASYSPSGGGLAQTQTKLVTVILPKAGLTTIGKNSFRYSTVKSLEIPATVKAIGESAFTGPSLLEQITIPEGVESIGNSAFSSSSIKSIKFPNSVTSFGTSVLGSCSALTQVELPNTMTAVPASFFRNSVAITTITIPNSVTEIGDNAFGRCSSLTTLILPAGLQKISGVGTFDGLATKRGPKLTNFAIPAGAKVVSNGTEGLFQQTFQYGQIESFTLPANAILQRTFQYCTTLKSVTLPEGVTFSSSTWASGTFQNTAITSIELPNSITSIPDETFKGAASLASVKFGNAVTSIGVSAFNGATSLTQVELPATVTSIGESAFSGAAALTKIIVNNPVPVPFVDQLNVFNGVNKATCVLYVPAGSEGAYREANLWKEFNNIRVIGSDAKEQTINGIADVLTGEVNSTIELAATATSGGDVTYEVTDGTIAKLEDNKLTFLKEGETTLTVSQAGDGIDWIPVTKKVKIVGVNYAWLQEVAITVEGNTARVVGPAESVAKFTRFYIGDTAIDGNSADISAATGELSLKAATSDGSEVIKLKINKQ